MYANLEKNSLLNFVYSKFILEQYKLDLETCSSTTFIVQLNQREKVVVFINQREKVEQLSWFTHLPTHHHHHPTQTFKAFPEGLGR